MGALTDYWFAAWYVIGRVAIKVATRLHKGD